MQKVRTAVESSQQYPLSEIVHLDEFTVGGKEEGKQGLSYDSKKKRAVIALKPNRKHKVKWVYVKSIEDYSVKSLTPIFEEHIITTAKVVTDKWRGNAPLKREYDIEQKYSALGKNFKEMHIIIMQLKSWLRAILTHVSRLHVQRYFDEFCFRINRSQFKEIIFHKTIERMVGKKLIYQKLIKQHVVYNSINLKESLIINGNSE